VTVKADLLVCKRCGGKILARSADDASPLRVDGTRRALWSI